MTENEKRAHDFALSVLPKMFDLRVNETAQAGSPNVKVDLYTEYISTYKKVLESFNRDFPDGK